jgi:hypothetical protein
MRDFPTTTKLHDFIDRLQIQSRWMNNRTGERMPAETLEELAERFADIVATQGSQP